MTQTRIFAADRNAPVPLARITPSIFAMSLGNLGERPLNRCCNSNPRLVLADEPRCVKASFPKGNRVGPVRELHETICTTVPSTSNLPLPGATGAQPSCAVDVAVD